MDLEGGRGSRQHVCGGGRNIRPGGVRPAFSARSMAHDGEEALGFRVSGPLPRGLFRGQPSSAQSARGDPGSAIRRRRQRSASKLRLPQRRRKVTGYRHSR
jgi:hypothetical protein